ncbi:MAG: DUF6605 domain-containing protein [Anaerolineae bacterium]
MRVRRLIGLSSWSICLVIISAILNEQYSVSASDEVLLQNSCANPANPIVAENCQPGTPDWHLTNQSLNIQIYASRDSVNVGETLEFYIDSTARTVDVRVLRIGYYGAAGARLVHEYNGILGIHQPSCARAEDSGLRTCSNWKSNFSLTVPADWVSGVYMAQVTNSDTLEQDDTVFVVRQDDLSTQLLYQMSTTTFAAYNNYGGKSLYYVNSSTCDTVSNTPRAVKVSLNRPYNASMYDPNYFFRAEYPMVRWLEQQGYDVSYSTNMDTHQSGKFGTINHLLDHKVFMMVGHDEYWSQEMRDAITDARDAGVHIASFSGNTAFWKVRFEPDPLTGEPESVMVTYKSAESDVEDPSGISTSVWRDPNRVNLPENELLGTMYIGFNDTLLFPFRIESAYTQDRIYRHTGLQNLPPDTYVVIDENMIGWEWDAIVNNGFTPSGLQILAESPVYGSLMQDPAHTEDAHLGLALAQTVRYTAASGAIVFSGGTIQWSWGLGAHGTEIVDADPIISQMTYNLFADMGVEPTTPVSSLILDGSDTPATTIPEARIMQVGKTKPAVISNIQMLPAVDSVTVSWDTDKDTVGQVWFGSSTDRVVTPIVADTDYATHHSVIIPDLLPDHMVYISISTVTRDWEFTLSDSVQVTTLSAPLTTQIRNRIQPLVQTGACWVRANTVGSAVLTALGAFVVLSFVGRLWFTRRHQNSIV